MNQQGLFSSSSDTPLAPEGVEQCQAAGKSLQQVGIDCIVSSPLLRTRHTAELIAQEIGISTDDIIESDFFVERSFGPLEGTPYSPTAKLDDTEGVEHSSELIDRVREGLEYLRTLDADTILVVSHGAVGRALRYLVQDETPFHGSEKFENAQVIQLL